MYDNKIIYGIDETEKIVSLEVKNDEVYAYFNDGSLKKQPATYFICSTFKIDNDFIRLGGTNDFRYVKTYNCLTTYKEDRKKFWRYKESVYSIPSPVETHMVTKGSTLFKGLKVDEVSRLGFDIESDGLLKHDDSTIYMISNTYRDSDVETKKVFQIEDYNNCGEMIVDWSSWVRELDPTLMIGHNVIGYDFPYIDHVAKLNGVTVDLGRDDSSMDIDTRTKNYRVDGSQTWEYNNISIFGRHVIDTMFLSVKYDIGRSFPSWGLKPIMEHLGMVKEGRQFYDASKIHQNWNDPIEREKIIAYGVDDGDDALDLYELMIPSYFYLTQSLPKSFQTIINGASGTWINSIFLRAYLQDFNSIPKASEVDGFEGAISYGVPGVYTNCFKQDVASLYPSIMRQYNVCDELKDPLKYFPNVVEYFTLERLRNKKLANETKDPYYRAMEQAQKLVINSMYGFLGARGLNFNSPHNASLVTRKGREILTKAMVWATHKDVNYWKELAPHTKLKDIDNGSDLVLVNCDTDSIMIAYKDGREWSNQTRLDFLEKMNNEFEDLIIWEDDGYYNRVVVVKSKNYVLLEDGSDKLKYKGSSFKSSNKEIALSEMMKKVSEGLVYENKSYVDIYNEYINEVKNIKDISRWCKKKSITENLLQANDTSKIKTLEAIKDIDYRVGDKVFLFNDIDGEKQKIVKGEPVFNKKDGSPKMIENQIYRLQDNFQGTYDSKHYLKRVYSTIDILKTVVDVKKVKNYSLTKNYKEFLDNSFNLV